MYTLPEITPQDMADLLVAALEGGINYWADSAIPESWPSEAKYASDVLQFGAAITIQADGADYTLTAENFELGIRKAADHHGQSVRKFIDDHDSERADSAVQFAIFGELVYG